MAQTNLEHEKQSNHAATDASSSIYPAEGMTMIMTGGEVNGSFVLSGHDQSGALQRWSTTSAVQGDSIVVHAEISNDEGKTWQPMGVSYLQRHQMNVLK